MTLLVPNTKALRTTGGYAMVAWWYVYPDSHNKFDWIVMIPLLMAKGALL